MAAQKIHLEESVLCGDEALCEDEIVERGSADVRYAVNIALYGGRRGEAGNGEGSVDLGERGLQNVLHIGAGREEGGEPEDEENGDGDGEIPGKAACRAGLRTHAALDQGRLVVVFRKAHLLCKV